MRKALTLVFAFVFLATLLGHTEAQKTHALLVSTVVCDWKCAYNYGVEADVFRAYHLLRKRGIPDDRIVLMTSDDFVRNPKNPWPGHVYNNERKEVDLRAGAKIDYRGREVTRENILAVLMGDRERVDGGSGQVIESGPDDNIFIFLAGHGDYGALMMPDHFRLTAHDLQAMIEELHRGGRYGRLLFYVMACMSGSLFTYLDPKYDAFIFSSSNTTEFSGVLEPVPVPEATLLGGKISFATCFGQAWFEALESSRVANPRRKSRLTMGVVVCIGKVPDNCDDIGAVSLKIYMLFPRTICLFLVAHFAVALFCPGVLMAMRPYFSPPLMPTPTDYLLVYLFGLCCIFAYAHCFALQYVDASEEGSNANAGFFTRRHTLFRTINYAADREKPTNRSVCRKFRPNQWESPIFHSLVSIC